MNLRTLLILATCYVIVIAAACYTLYRKRTRQEHALDRTIARQYKPVRRYNRLDLWQTLCATIELPTGAIVAGYDFRPDGPFLAVGYIRDGLAVVIDARLERPIYWFPEERDAVIRDLRRAGAWIVRDTAGAGLAEPGDGR